MNCNPLAAKLETVLLQVKNTFCLSNTFWKQNGVVYFLPDTLSAAKKVYFRFPEHPGHSFKCVMYRSNKTEFCWSIHALPVLEKHFSPRTGFWSSLANARKDSQNDFAMCIQLSICLSVDPPPNVILGQLSLFLATCFLPSPFLHLWMF